MDDIEKCNRKTDLVTMAVWHTSSRIAFATKDVILIFIDYFRPFPRLLRNLRCILVGSTATFPSSY